MRNFRSAAIGYFPEDSRSLVDRLFIEVQPGHIQHLATQDKLDELDAAGRDAYRAAHLRVKFAAFPPPDFLGNENPRAQNDN
ncbi:MAG: hypothetical protein LBM92_06960 [Opitutaceae bacterium]|nr:hypothetical protein [Opitutaceae bacterium]